MDSLWLPHSGEAQAFHGQIMNTTYTVDAGAPLAYGAAVSLNSPVESRAASRMRFDGGTDLIGMPRFELEFGLSTVDETLLEEARDQHAAIFRLFGDFAPHEEAGLLPAGSSLHPTGTVRAGAEDDGTSVTDPTGRVWGSENVFLAGNGVARPRWSRTRRSLPRSLRSALLAPHLRGWRDSRSDPRPGQGGRRIAPDLRHPWLVGDAARRPLPRDGSTPARDRTQVECYQQA